MIETQPVGMCACGCGKETAIAARSFKKRGISKGDHLRFIYGHSLKMKEVAENWSHNKKKYVGEGNPNWKGDLASAPAGRYRARGRYKLGNCERCWKKAVDRHHKDGNPLNNDPSNIRRLCRDCHMIEDGRANGRLKGLKIGIKFSESAKIRMSEAHKKGAYHACLNCGTVFWVTPHQSKEGKGKFCSHKCFGEYTRGDNHWMRKECLG